MRRTYWPIYDVLVVLAFTGIGRESHDEKLTVAGWAHTAWPFLVGLSAGWVLAQVLRRQPGAVRGAGLIVWLATVAVGMVLRVISGAGTAVSFTIVALSFLGVFLLGARALVAVIAPRLRGRT